MAGTVVFELGGEGHAVTREGELVGLEVDQDLIKSALFSGEEKQGEERTRNKEKKEQE